MLADMSFAWQCGAADGRAFFLFVLPWVFLCSLRKLLSGPCGKHSERVVASKPGDRNP